MILLLKIDQYKIHSDNRFSICGVPLSIAMRVFYLSNGASWKEKMRKGKRREKGIAVKTSAPAT